MLMTHNTFDIAQECKGFNRKKHLILKNGRTSHLYSSQTSVQPYNVHPQDPKTWQL